MFYTVSIVDTIPRRDNTLEHRLVEYQIEDSTGAAARATALEHHLARPDRDPLAAVRWAILGRTAIAFERVVQTSERTLEPAELQLLEEINRPYIVA